MQSETCPCATHMGQNYDDFPRKALGSQSPSKLGAAPGVFRPAARGCVCGSGGAASSPDPKSVAAP